MASGAEPDSVQIQEWLDEATKADASEHQIAVLERALKAGTVTRADVDEVFADTLQCLDDSGFTYHVVEDEASPGSGLTYPNFSVVLPPGSSNSDMETLADVSDKCSFGQSIYVVSAYTNQASSREIQDAAWNSDSMLSCLKQRGFEVPKGATVDEIAQVYSAERDAHGADPDYPGPCA